MKGVDEDSLDEDQELERKKKEQTELAQFLESQGLSMKEQARYAARAAAQKVTQEPQVKVVYSIARSRADVPCFSGDIVYYKEWKISFQMSVSMFPELEHMEILREKLGVYKSIVLPCIGSSSGAMEQAWELLDKEYIRPRRVEAILLADLTKLVSTPCREESQFPAIVMRVRERFDRLVSNRKMGMFCLDTILCTWVDNMPDSVSRCAIKIMVEREDDWNFPTILVMAEKRVERIEARVWCRESANIQRKSAGIQPVSTDSHPREAAEISDEKNIRDAQTQTPGGFGYVPKSERACERPTTDSVMEVSVAECRLCISSSHLTVDCRVCRSEDELRTLVTRRHICQLCGLSGHKSVGCPWFTVHKNHTLTCKSDLCDSQNPHSSVFCALNKKQT